MTEFRNHTAFVFVIGNMKPKIFMYPLVKFLITA